ncbi:unnamed protein product [Prunus armeniaca]
MATYYIGVNNMINPHSSNVVTSSTISTSSSSTLQQDHQHCLKLQRHLNVTMAKTTIFLASTTSAGPSRKDH